jgi:hypothetical protein
MIQLALLRFASLLIITCLSVITYGQPSTEAKKPYKIHTNGKQVTVKSTKNIKSVMVWTASGHRIVEQKEINNTSFTFDTTAAAEKVFFLMIQYEGSKPFTEKIGVR